MPSRPAGTPWSWAWTSPSSPRFLQARVSAFNAKPPFGPMEPATPGEEAESGRGLALIQALVTTVTFERQDGTNTWVLSRTSAQT